MKTDILSSFSIQKDSECFQALSFVLSSNRFDPVTHVQTQSSLYNLREIPFRHPLPPSSDILSSIRKKLQLEKQAKFTTVDRVWDYEVQTDLKYDARFHSENSFRINKHREHLKQKLLAIQKEREQRNIQEKQEMKKQLSIWFQQSKLEELEKKQNGNRVEVTVHKNLQEGMQVSGIIMARRFKINYPNQAYVLKVTDLPEIVPKETLKKYLRPLNQVDSDIMNDLRNYVWKAKQYKSFFEHLLSFSMNNTEISTTLVQVQKKMGTTFYHVMTFYQISSKTWRLPKSIRDLNKKTLFVRERQNFYDDMLLDIYEDLDEIFRPLSENLGLIPDEELIVSFEQYRTRLQELKRARNH